MTDKLTGNKEHQPLTSGIKHWGLSGYASVLPRIEYSGESVPPIPGESVPLIPDEYVPPIPEQSVPPFSGQICC